MQAHTRWLLTMVSARVNRSVDMRKFANDQDLSNLTFENLDWQDEIRRCSSKLEERERLVGTLHKIYRVRFFFWLLDSGYQVLTGIGTCHRHSLQPTPLRNLPIGVDSKFLSNYHHSRFSISFRSLHLFIE